MGRTSKTPRENTVAVAAGNLAIQTEMQDMTRAFEDARSSNRLPEPNLAQRIRQAWDTLRFGIHSRKA